MKDRECDISEIAAEIDRRAECVAHLQPGTAAYQQETFALIEQLYLYLTLLSEKKYADKGLEVVETAHDCLQNYNEEKGLFRHYFMVAVKRRVEGENNASQQLWGGIVLPRQDRRNIRAIVAISNKTKIPLDSESLVETAAELLQESPEEIRRLLAVNQVAVAVSGSPFEDQETGLLDAFPSEEHLEQDILDGIRAGELFREIDLAFHDCRPGQKAVISRLLTTKILAELPDMVNRLSLRQYGFWDAGTEQAYIAGGGTAPFARQIAAELGRNEASVSRTLREFLKRVRGSHLL